MTDERTAFRDFKSSPSPDSLIRLLRAQQERVYRLCLQVLRRAQDAEDAAQEVLIRIVDGVRRIDDPDAFRRWVYRVSLNAALEAARKASRRREHESRAAMEVVPGNPLDEESRRALFEAIARLDEGPRSLILDHYFEGETLESLGSREGVSAQAVSKRLDRARVQLKRALPAAVMGIPDLGLLFERGVSSPVVPDLVSGAVLAKVQSVAAALAAGGAVVASKISIVAAVAVTAFFCLIAGTGLGLLLKSRAVPDDRAKVVELERRLADALRRSSVPEPTPAPTVRTTNPSTTPEPGVAASGGSRLTARLKRYKDWRNARAKEKTSLGDKLVLDQKLMIKYLAKKSAELTVELEGIRDLIFENPMEFLGFLRDPENEGCIVELANYAFGFLDANSGSAVWNKISFGTFPKALTDGLLEFLRGGSAAQKDAAMSFFGHVSDLPEEFNVRWTALLDDPDPQTRCRAVRLAGEIPAMPPETLKVLLRVGRTSLEPEVRREVATAMSWVSHPEAQVYLLDRLEAATDSYEITNAAMAMTSKFYASSQGGAAVDQERFLRSASKALDRGLDEGALKYVIYSVLFAPADKARPLVERARAVSPTVECQDAMTAILRKIDAGESNRDALLKLLWPPR